MSREREIRKQVSRELAVLFPEIGPSDRFAAAEKVAATLRPIDRSPEAVAAEVAGAIIREALADLPTSR